MFSIGSKLVSKIPGRIGSGINNFGMKNVLDDAGEVVGRGAGKFRSSIGNMGFGADIGMGMGAAGNGIDAIGEGDFDISDFIGDTLKGGAMGAAGFGIGKLLGKSPIGGRLMESGARVIGGGVGPLIGTDGHLIGTGKSGSAVPGGLGGSLGPEQGPTLGGLGGGGSIMEYLEGIGAAPNAPSMTLGQYMENGKLNGIADAQIGMQIDPLERQIGTIQKEAEIDQASNVSIGQALQNQMQEIRGTNADNTDAIIDSNADAAERTDAQTDSELGASGAMLAGNENTRMELAAEHAADEARISERRMADSELLQRLGVSTGEMLAEMQASEVQQTGVNATKIRTNANDNITEVRNSMSDIRKQRPGILGSLAQGAFDSSISKHQAALGTYQAKLSAAKAKTETVMGALKAESDAQGAAVGPGSEQLYGSSGFTAMNENTGHADGIPEYALLTEQEAMRQGVPQGMWQKWQPIVAGLQLG